MRLKWIQLIVIILISFFLFSANNCKKTHKKIDTRSYMLAFTEKGTSRIRVRWSSNGNTWKSSKFRNEKTNLGVGIGADSEGILRIIPWVTTSNNVKFAWGLGGVFDQETYSVTTQTATSAPSAVYGKKYNWFVAFRTSGNTIALRTYNSHERKFLDRNDAPIENALNDNVGGRPALCRLKTNLIMAWERLGHIRLAVANISSDGGLTWTSKHFLSIPDHVGNTYYSLVDGDPSLTHDNSNFYIGFTRRTKRPPHYEGEFLVRNDLTIYKSSDGISWSYFTKMQRIPNRPIVNIAARSDGSILAAVVGDNKYAMYRYETGHFNCTELNKQSVFNWTPKPWQQFALISMGRVIMGRVHR